MTSVPMQWRIRHFYENIFFLEINQCYQYINKTKAEKKFLQILLFDYFTPIWFLSNRFKMVFYDEKLCFLKNE